MSPSGTETPGSRDSRPGACAGAARRWPLSERQGAVASQRFATDANVATPLIEVTTGAEDRCERSTHLCGQHGHVGEGPPQTSLTSHGSGTGEAMLARLLALPSAALSLAHGTRASASLEHTQAFLSPRFNSSP